MPVNGRKTKRRVIYRFCLLARNLGRFRAFSEIYANFAMPHYLVSLSIIARRPVPVHPGSAAFFILPNNLYLVYILVLPTSPQWRAPVVWTVRRSWTLQLPGHRKNNQKTGNARARSSNRNGICDYAYRPGTCNPILLHRSTLTVPSIVHHTEHGKEFPGTFRRLSFPISFLLTCSPLYA